DRPAPPRLSRPPGDDRGSSRRVPRYLDSTQAGTPGGSRLRRLRRPPRRALRLVRWLPQGVLLPLRSPPFLPAHLPGERLHRRPLRPRGARRHALQGVGTTRRV
ncbi:MAG: hypothetical protein AVDCRST_MAG59-2159, partial [uncultured Thermomicrobiales bacterium]